VEYGPVPTPITLKRRRQRLVTQLKNLGYDVQLTPRISDASRARFSRAWQRSPSGRRPYADLVVLREPKSGRIVRTLPLTICI